MAITALAVLLFLTFIMGFYIGASKPESVKNWHIILHGFAWGYCLHVVLKAIT